MEIECLLQPTTVAHRFWVVRLRENHRLLVIRRILAIILNRLKVNRLMTILLMFEHSYLECHCRLYCIFHEFTKYHKHVLVHLLLPQWLAMSKRIKFPSTTRTGTCDSNNHPICVEFLNGILGKMLEPNAEQIKETNYFRTCNECWMFCPCIYNFSMAFSIDAVARSEFSLSIKKTAHTHTPSVYGFKRSVPVQPEMFDNMCESLLHGMCTIH